MKSLAIALLVVAVAAPSGDKVIVLSHSVLSELPRVSAKVRTHGSAEEATYGGVTLAALLAKAGVPSGEAIRGDKLSLVVIAKAADGYSAVYALAELDPAFSKKMFLLADRKNGAPLPAEEGPFRLIVPDESRQARWVRQVTSLTVHSVK